MFGFSGGEFLVLLLVIVIVVGPQRLPEYTRTVTQWVRQLRLLLENAKQQIAEEVGPELADIDLSDLDPRNYDPRKIVRDALGEDIEAIRKDFENPIKSVVQAAQTSSEAAAGEVNDEVNAGTSSKSLKQMIDDKAEETRAARVASPSLTAAPTVTTGAGAAVAATADDAAEAGGAVAEPVAPSAPAQAEEADAAQSAEGADETSSASEESGAVEPGDGEVGDAATGPGADESGAPAQTAAETEDEAVDEDEVEDPERRALLTSAAESAGDVVEDVVGILDPADIIEEVPDPAAGQAAEPAAVPSSLVAPPEGTPNPVADRVRPVSPRDIVRAANQAAHTRAAAARARVDA